MANIMYFIGAGASQSATEEAPLMNDFFQKCSPFLKEPVVYWAFVMLYYHRIFEKNYPELENLAAQIRITKDQDQAKLLDQFINGIKENLSHQERLENLESVFSRAEVHRQKTEEEEPYTGLLQLINFILIQLYKQNPNSPAYAKLTEVIKNYLDDHQHTLVSFNYDLWLENTLFDSGIWNPIWGFVGYPIPNRYFLSSDINNGYLAESREIDTHSLENKNVLVLKPHGCLCWFQRKKYNSELLWALTEDGNVGFYDGYNASYPPIRELIQQGMEADIIYPLLVPPTPAKQKSHPILWQTEVHLRQRLLTADTVVIIGWSMPETDKEDKGIIEHAIQHRETQIKKLIICDRKEDLAHYSRFEQLFRAEKCFSWKNGFSEGFVEYLTRICFET